MIRRPPRSTLSSSSAASDVYKRQGGMRAAGDLVARMQMTRGMRLKAAKEYVADKLGVSAFDLSDPAVMTEVRNEHGFGRIHSYAISHPGQANFIEAKFNISRVLDIPINCVERFKERAGVASQ